MYIAFNKLALTFEQHIDEHNIHRTIQNSTMP